VLIDNAIRYTPAGGFIVVKVTKKDSTLLLSIQDSGIGMTLVDRKNLFKKFYRGTNAKTTDTEGMGLGLYAAKKIVDGHGGRLWAESQGLNKGSIFYLELKHGKNYRG
jgi:signal transduction histidine kinase